MKSVRYSAGQHAHTHTTSPTNPPHRPRSDADVASRMRLPMAFLLFAALGSGALLSRPAHAQYVVLPPPAAAYAPPPPPMRSGYAWQPGYWGWQYGRYVWVPPHWVSVGAPVMRQPRRVQQVIRLSADALFPFDKGEPSDILPGGRADIREIASRLMASPFETIEVRGYTDRLGGDAYNQRLSERRANAVKALLIQDGMPAEKINAVGLGKQDPVTTCADGQSHDVLVACLQPNRRVEIVTYTRGEMTRRDPARDDSLNGR